MVVEAGMEAGNFRRCKGYFAQISLKFARNTFMQQTISLQNFFSCWYIILSSTNCHRIQHTNCLAWNLVLNNPTEDVTLGCWRTLSEVSCLSTLQHLHHSYEVWHSIHIPAVAFSKELTWVYLAIIGNFQLKKEVFAKTPGHRKKNGSLSSRCRLTVDNLCHQQGADRSVEYTWERAARWSTKLCRKCWCPTAGRGTDSINPAKMKLCSGCHILCI